MPFDLAPLHLDDHPTLNAFLNAVTIEEIERARDALLACDLLSMTRYPSPTSLRALPLTSPQAYIRIDGRVEVDGRRVNCNALFYVNTTTTPVLFTQVTNDVEMLKRFDARFPTRRGRAISTLFPGSFGEITTLVRHTPPLPKYTYRAPKSTSGENISLYGICSAMNKTRHLRVLEELNPLKDDMLPFNILNLVRFAASYGCLDVVNFLLEKEHVRNAVSSGMGTEITLAFQNGHDAVVRRLLDFEGPLLCAEAHSNEFVERFVHPLIDEKLKEIATRKAEFEAVHGGEVFDIANEGATYYFYLLRNLIGRNDPALRISIDQLLSLPSLQAILTHQLPADTPSVVESNQLLRYAAAVGNSFAVKALLNFSAVSELAKSHGFYSSEGPAIGLQAWAMQFEREKAPPIVTSDTDDASEATPSAPSSVVSTSLSVAASRPGVDGPTFLEAGTACKRNRRSQFFVPPMDVGAEEAAAEPPESKRRPAPSGGPT